MIQTISDEIVPSFSATFIEISYISESPTISQLLCVTFLFLFRIFQVIKVNLNYSNDAKKNILLSFCMFNIESNENKRIISFKNIFYCKCTFEY